MLEAPRICICAKILSFGGRTQSRCVFPTFDTDKNIDCRNVVKVDDKLTASLTVFDSQFLSCSIVRERKHEIACQHSLTDTYIQVSRLTVFLRSFSNRPRNVKFRSRTRFTGFFDCPWIPI